MTTIYKYPLPVRDEILLSLPEGAEFLATQVREGRICLWAKVVTERPLQKRRVRLYETGAALPEGESLAYVGTVQKGAFTYHVMEKLPAEPAS